MRRTEPARDGAVYRDDEETQLMLAFQRGSRSAFERLVSRTQERVFRLALRYMGDASSAEDVTQDVFVRVYNAGESYRPTARFSTWVYRITVNLSLNALRDSRGRPEISLEADAGGGIEFEDESAGGAPEEAIESAELSEAVSRAVGALPEAQRTVLLLRRYEELSYEEIAEVTGKAPTAVKSLLARARQNLKIALKKHLER